MRWLIVVVIAAGCINPDLVPCGANSCPAGTVCTPAGQCASQQQLDACAGVADNATCTLDAAAGLCESGVCTLPHCGNGIVEPGEACDGSVAADIDCSYFGYYRGSVSCTDICELSPAACSGRCGDGVTDLDQGEYCDQSVAPNASCFDFGYDLGDLTCGRSCGPDLVKCGMYGFTATTLPLVPIVSLWGGFGSVGAVNNNGDAWARVGDGLWSQGPPMAFDVIGGSATTIWAVGPSDVATWTSSTGWTDVAAPWPATSNPVDIWASDSLGVFVSLDNSALLWHRDLGGTWTQVTGAWSAGVTFGLTHTDLYVMSNPVQVWDGSTWAASTLATMVEVTEDSSGVLWGTTNAGALNELVGTTWTFVVAIGAHLVGGGPDGPYAASSFCSLICSTELSYAGHEPWSVELSQGLFRADGAGRVYYGLDSGGLDVVTYGIWLDDLSEGGFFPGNFASATGGPMVLSDSGGTQQLGPLGWVPSEQNCDLAVVSATGSLYCVTGTTLTDDDDAGVTNVHVAALWVANGDAAAAGDHSFAWRSAGTWQTSTPAIKFSELGGDQVTDLYALGVADGQTMPQLWHFDGSSWHSISSPIMNLGNLAVTPSRVVAVDGTDLVVFDRTLQMTTTEATPAPFTALTGVSGEELFAVTNTFPTGGSPLWRWDGVQWAPLKVPDNIAIINVTHAGRDVVLVTHNPSSLIVGTEYYRLARTGPW